MDKPLTLEDIDEKTRPKVYVQEYNKKTLIDGVKIFTINHVLAEEGDFAEMMRINERGEAEGVPGFFVRQINRSTQFPGSIKAWHLHLKQDEIWYVPEESQLLAGLWDVRKDSKTRGMTNRFVLGASTHQFLHIPRGVAHGSVNFSNETGIIIYFVNNQFDKDNPDENRIPWDVLGADFWKPERD